MSLIWPFLESFIKKSAHRRQPLNKVGKRSTPHHLTDQSLYGVDLPPKGLYQKMFFEMFRRLRFLVVFEVLRSIRVNEFIVDQV